VVLAMTVALVWAVRKRDPGLDAARFTALASSLEAGMRIEHLAPAHDLRPALAKVRAQVERLRAEARDSGPASYALGKGLQILGDDDAARAAYEAAWAAGFQTPEVADGLGAVLSRWRSSCRTSAT
jgi:hypothetical protein